MPASARRNHKRGRDKHAPRPPAGKRTWLAPPIGAVTIVVLADLLVSIAWGALAGLAGATILRARLATLMHDDRQRFPARPPGRG